MPGGFFVRRTGPTDRHLRGTQPMTTHTVTSENAAEFYASRLPQREAPKADEPTEAKTDDKSESTTPDPKPKTKPIQPRINELVAERNTARDEAEAAALERDQLRRELDEVKQQMQAMSKPAEASDRPARDDFKSDGDFEQAMDDWKFERRLADHQQRQAQARLVENWRARLDQAQSDIPDLAEVLGKADVQLPQTALDAIVESDTGPQIAYHLAKNPNEARRIASMSAAGAAREIGRLEAQMTQSVKVAEKSKAPAPIEPLKGTSSTAIKDPSGMTYEEWKEARRAGRIK